MIIRPLFITLSFAVIAICAHERFRAMNGSLSYNLLKNSTRLEKNGQNITRVNLNQRDDESFNIKKFRDDALAEHNKYRKDHGVQPLKLDAELNDMAQRYADYLAKIGKSQHSQTRNVGENLFYKNSSDPITAASVVNEWYREINNYDFYDTDSNLDHYQNIGHFTQLIWRNTTDVGFGYAANNSNIFIVANYKPQGNVKHHFDENVPEIEELEEEYVSPPSDAAHDVEVTAALLFACTLLVTFTTYIYY